MSNFYELQRELKQLQRDCTAITSNHQQAMADIEKLYQPIGSTTPPSTPQVAGAPAERRWQYLNEHGLISHELSQKATRDPQLFAAILEEVQEAADQVKQQN